jgi:acetylornithine deacetylase/succinyl-diaminopimelate desuccinylase-like protein
VRAGQKINVVPATATVELDGRLIPGQTVASFLAELRGVLGDEAHLEVTRAHAGVETTTDGELFSHLVRTVGLHDPTAVPLPYMVPGFTDASAYSALGTRCYGFCPVRFDPTAALSFSRMYHGDDERIPVAGLAWGLRVLHDAVAGFARA